MTSEGDSELSDAAQQLQEEHAPDCGDCGTKTELRGVQEPGVGDRWIVQWICPDCEPQRVKLTRGLPEGYEVVKESPADHEQLMLGQVATDGGTSGSGRCDHPTKRGRGIGSVGVEWCRDCGEILEVTHE